MTPSYLSDSLDFLASPDSDLSPKFLENTVPTLLVVTVMMLGGARTMGGDLGGALSLLNLKLVPSDGHGVRDIAVELSRLIERRECPKCGGRQLRLSAEAVERTHSDAAGTDWYHEDPQYGGVLRRHIREEDLRDD